MSQKAPCEKLQGGLCLDVDTTFAIDFLLSFQLYSLHVVASGYAACVLNLSCNRSYNRTKLWCDCMCKLAFKH